MKIDIKQTAMEIFKIENGILIECDEQVEGEVIVPSTVNMIAEAAFFGCNKVQSVYIPDGVTHIGDSAFYSCPSLREVRLPSGLKEIGDEAFEDCGSLKSISIPSSVRRIGEAVLAGCVSLDSVVVDKDNAYYYSDGSDCIIERATGTLIAGCRMTRIPEGVTSIGQRAFQGQIFLRSVELPESLFEICKDAFYGCTSLKAIDIPYAVSHISEGAFSACPQLSHISVDIINPVYESRNDCNAIITKDDHTMIVGCSATVIPEYVKAIAPYAFAGSRVREVKGNIESIGKGAFSHCKSLVSVHLPSVRLISELAFADCDSLSSVSISSAAQIGRAVYTGCRSLRGVSFETRQNL